jgi:hypothetical protein
MPPSHSRNTKSAKTNRVPNAIKQAKWIYQLLEDAKDAMERGDSSLLKVIKYWNIPLTSFSNHFNSRTKSRKVGPKVYWQIGRYNNCHLGFEHPNY